jgi:hypothetical protein
MLCKRYENNALALGVYNELGVHSKTQQLLEVCITTILASSVFMQPAFITATAVAWQQ